jgi:manganese/zinc/iron transport system ATP- binding protein
VFIVHHDLNTIKDYFDWLIILNMRLIENGPTHEVFTQEVLEKAYGKSKSLFIEATKKQKEKTTGNI